MTRVNVGVIGGSGAASLVRDDNTVWPHTPYGRSSAPIAIGSVGSLQAAYLARHGDSHELPPHRINYRANLWSLAKLGARSIVAYGAVGSLRRDWSVGDVVVPSQFANHTWGRPDTYFDGPLVVHTPMADPYCPDLTARIAAAARARSIPVHLEATEVVIQGPRYSTRAENRNWVRLGYDVISMTHYPEVVLARELGMCFVAVCLITDFASLPNESPEAEVATHDDVLAASREHAARMSAIVSDALVARGTETTCSCQAHLPLI